MSKIIKGGNTKFFNFLLEIKGNEETFSPLKALLPEEALLEIEKKKLEEEEQEKKRAPEPEEVREEEEQALAEEAEEEKEEVQEEVKEEEEVESEATRPFDFSELSLEDLLSHPQVSERLALLEQEAYEKGFAQGQKDGETIGRKKYEILHQRLEEVLKNLEKEIAEHVLSLEPQLFSLIKLMVEKLVLKEISTGPEVIRAVLREALGHVVEQARVKIRLHPDDTEFVEEVLPSLREELSRIKDFEVVPDSNLKRGGCLLETDFGLVDATLERRWQELLKRLEDENT